MKTRSLGHSGVKVSTLCMGAMTFGEPDEGSFMHGVASDVPTSFRVLDQAVEAGINFIDNADIYGQDGLAESVLGDWFAASGKRDDVVLATKFRFRTRPGPNGAGASRYRIVRCVEDSLRRLKTDRIDLYQIHMQDLTTPEEELLAAFDQLVRQGKVLYTGCSNYAAYHLADSLHLADRKGYPRFVTMQMQYSLLVRDIEREHVPIAKRHGVGILPWSPLAGGFLTGKYREGQAPPEGSRMSSWKDAYARYDKPRNWAIVEALIAVADEVDATPAQVALAWLLHKPWVTSVIFGARNATQLEDNLKAADLDLSADQLTRLDTASDFEVGYPYDFIRRVTGGW